jgi:apolipoprotein N-acyltransferase
LKKLSPLLLSLLSGLLLFAAWPVSPLTFLTFIAFVPLLWLEQQGIRRRKFFGWVYLSMLIWNLATTWWIWNASEPGAAGAILANSLLMCIPWLGFHFVKSRLGDKPGYLSLVTFWMSFEYFHLSNWGLSWPWLTSGNVFATHPGWIQWYEYTGVSGGGLWIWIVNLLVFFLLRKRFTEGRFHAPTMIGIVLAMAIPMTCSYLVTPKVQATDSAASKNIIIVQPNIDPYEKLSTGSFDAQLQKLLRLSEAAGIDSNTTLIVWPETALYTEYGFEEDSLKKNYFLNPLWDLLRKHPSVNLLTGIESFRFYKSKQTITAKNIPGSPTWYDSYNAATVLDSSGPIAFYHKTMLVPGVETLPPFLHFLDSWFEKFGGTASGYAGQSDRTVLPTSNHSYRIAPAVCYESIYGGFMSAYIRNGADVIAVITNDGWWGNTPGYRQHLNYARLRAIETRRWVIRSANTGVSCIIDPSGKILDAQPWVKAAFIKKTVPTSNIMTFYVRNGDILSTIAVAGAIILVLWTFVVIIKKKINRA